MSEWFPGIEGHDEAKAALRRGVEGHRLTGAFLLVGPDGVGRSLLARALAQALNCRHEGPDVPCGRCGPCHRIARELSGDFVRVGPAEGKQSIGIEQVQTALAELALAPVESETRVFLFDPAGALTEPAQNALLKGLEEPPARALIVLICEREGELLPTVASRCRVVRLGELPRERIVELVVARGVAPAEAEARARWCAGSLGRALADDALEVSALAEQAVAAFVSGEAARDPMATAELLSEFVGPGKADLATQRQRIAAVLSVLMRTLRDAVVLREGGAERGLRRLSGADAALLRALAALPRGRLERATERLAQVEDELSQNVNTKLLLDGLVLEVGGALVPVDDAPDPVRAGAPATRGGRRATWSKESSSRG